MEGIRTLSPGFNIPVKVDNNPSLPPTVTHISLLEKLIFKEFRYLEISSLNSSIPALGV